MALASFVTIEVCIDSVQSAIKLVSLLGSFFFDVDVAACPTVLYRVARIDWNFVRTLDWVVALPPALGS